MATQIKCPHCKNEIEITEALRNELKNNIQKELEDRYKDEIQSLKDRSEKEKEELKASLYKDAKKQAIEKIRGEYDSKIEETKQESQEIKESNKKLQEEMSELMKQMRKQREESDRMKIEYEKKMMEEEESIKQKALEAAEAEWDLKVAEKDKKLLDAQKQIKELERKMQQGSQQSQGEVLELKLEETLRAEFPYDEIKEVPKGIRGGDIVQVVQTKSGSVCGTILWEIKNTKNWSGSWVQKLKDDQRTLKAELSIIVSTVLPEGINSIGQQDGVWISDINSSIGLAHSLRSQLINIQSVRVANKGKEQKAEIVYNYLISNEFKQRIELWVEYFNQRQQELEKEKRYFTAKWQKEEKNISKIVENTVGIYGDLQGLIGSSMPQIKSLELPEEDSVETDEDVKNLL